MANHAKAIDPGIRYPPDGPAHNPFNPGFGLLPPVLAGSDELVAEILTRLARGPGRIEYLTLSMGPGASARPRY
jgi:hypothetical protein